MFTPNRPAPKRIHKLDETVVNKIAAGEIIVRPANAVKEMIENSLDAGASEISVIVKNGGLGMIQIHDNGCGIKREDLSIACERFTTSKIDTFEDLASLQSFGFRGEALSSISFIAKVKIITRTADSVCAFQVEYGLGKPLGLEKPCAGNIGTIITVENFFYNNPTRRSILSSPSDEYIRLQEVVTKYAMRYPHVGFSLKKFGEHVADVRTPAHSTTLENCKVLFGNSIARELLAVEGESDKYHCKVSGHVTNPNFSIKKITFLLFINGRSVDCNKLKRSLELLYATHLPKNGFPFIYLSLDLPPSLIDVNIHPTKAEVYFRFEEDIIAFIYTLVERQITTCQVSRSFTIQTQLLPSMSQGSSTVEVDYPATQMMASQPSQPALPPLPPKKSSEPRKLVRTDSAEQTLNAFLRPVGAMRHCDHEDQESERDAAIDPEEDGTSETYSLTSVLVTKESRRQLNLTTVLELRAEVEENMDEQLRRIISRHKFVGCVSHTTALVQYQTRLYAVNVQKLSEELFYQLILYDFGDFGLMKTAEPVSLRGLMEAAIDFSDVPIEEPVERAEIATHATELLLSKAAMLEDYFSLQLSEDGRLVSLPLLLSDYVPPLSELPQYIASLVTEVDWTKEKECFDGIARTTAQFYAFRRDFYAALQEDNANDDAWKWTVEHVLFPSFRSMLLPGKDLWQSRAFVQLADLPNLYRVFERC